MSVPARTFEQRREALELANRVRTYRAELKRDLAAGRVRFVEALADPWCESMRVYDLLLAVPGVGRVKANRLLHTVRASPSKTCGGLTGRQRHELLVAFRVWEQGVARARAKRARESPRRPAEPTVLPTAAYERAMADLDDRRAA